MRSCMYFSQVDASIWRSKCFACQHNPYRGRSVRRILLPFLSFQDWHNWISAHMIYSYKVYLTPWIFAFTGFSDMSNMDIYSRDPLRFWGSFSLWMSPTFSEESPKWSANFLNYFRASWRLCSVRSIRGSPLLLKGLRMYYRSADSASFWGLLVVPMFYLVLGGSTKFSEGLFWSGECVPGSLLPAFSYRRLLTEKVSMGHFPFFRQAFECSRIYSFSARRRG